MRSVYRVITLCTVALCAAPLAFAGSLGVTSTLTLGGIALGLLGLGAVVEGGVFGTYRNSIGGVTFSTWRSLQTARQKSSPANPQTAAQTAVRTLFSYAVRILKIFGSGFYSVDWNYARGILPGFQSLMKTMLDGADYDQLTMPVPSDVALGTLSLPADLDPQPNVPAGIGVAWDSTGLPADDNMVVFAYPRLHEPVDTYIPRPITVPIQDEAAVLPELNPSTEYIVGMYRAGGGANEGNYSPCTFAAVVSAAAA